MSSALPLAGTSLAGRYRLERALGEGASSVVFAGRDLRLDRAVAVKVLKPQVLLDAGIHRERFLNEARVLAKLAHPHIAPVFDVGETAEGAAFFVMELAGERTLARELEARGQLFIEEALTLLLPVMGAVAMAHDAGIIHRDIKPANVVLEAREQGPVRAKLLDFGIAKLSNVDTSSGHALGTPSFMAPEQVSAGNVRASTDVWAMGVLLFRCLSGKLPFEAPAATGVLLKIVHERAPRFADACPSIGPHVAVALDQALEPNPEARPQSMRDLARNLAAACRQDGIRLPVDPDPVGLPRFPDWFQSADVERTVRAPVLQAVVSSTATVPWTAPSVARRPRRRQWLMVGLAMVIGIVWVSALSNLGSTSVAESSRYVSDKPAVVSNSAPPIPDTLPTERTSEIDGPVPTIASSAPDAAKPTLAPKPEIQAPPKAITPKRASSSHVRERAVPAPQLIKDLDW